MDEDLNTNPDWNQRRQNRATAFRFLFQWEMNPSDDLKGDLTEFLDRLGRNEEFYSYAIELVDGIEIGAAACSCSVSRGGEVGIRTF